MNMFDAILYMSAKNGFTLECIRSLPLSRSGCTQRAALAGVHTGRFYKRKTLTELKQYSKDTPQYFETKRRHSSCIKSLDEIVAPNMLKLVTLSGLLH